MVYTFSESSYNGVLFLFADYLKQGCPSIWIPEHSIYNGRRVTIGWKSRWDIMYDGPGVKEKIKKKLFLRDHKKIFYFLSPKNGHNNKVLFCLSLKTVAEI